MKSLKFFALKIISQNKFQQNELKSIILEKCLHQIVRDPKTLKQKKTASKLFWESTLQPFLAPNLNRLKNYSNWQQIEYK